MAVETNLDISPEQRKTLIGLLNRYIPNTTVWAFGSRAKWQARVNSDLDLVAFATPSQSASISGLKEALEESNLPFKVDLLVWNNIPKSFQENIESHYVILLKAQAEQASIDSKELNSITDIVDFNPKRELQRGKEAKYIDMSALPTDGRDIHEISKRVFSGSGSKFKNGDTLFSRITPCLENGKTAKVSCLEQGEIAAGSTEFIVLAPKKDTDENFVYYLARLPEFRTYAISRMEGTSGRQRVSWQALSEFKFNFPDPETRKKIGLHLKIIDDKIELNNQINQTLEAMAQAIFKSWFVDFEPVKAKMASLQAGGSQAEAELAAMIAISGKTAEQLSTMQTIQAEAYQQLAETAALFPSAMQDTELGKIPEGWSFEQLGNYLDVLETGSRPKGGVGGIKSGIPSVGAENINGVGNYSFGKEKFVSEDYFNALKRGVIEDFDFLLYKDGGKPGEFKPRVSMFGCGFPYTKFAINEHVFRMRSTYLGQAFLYFQIGHENILGELANRGGKAAIPGINQNDVKTLNILLPQDDKILSAFNEIGMSALKSILTRAFENIGLTVIRDSLLPKLLSGEIDLSGTDEVAV